MQSQQLLHIHGQLHWQEILTLSRVHGFAALKATQDRKTNTTKVRVIGNWDQLHHMCQQHNLMMNLVETD